MPMLDLGDRSLYYELHGDSGDPLVCVMGLAANTLGWSLQVRSFAKRHRTLIYDNRDVGQSSLDEGLYDVGDLAADALALADGLGLETFHVLGVSMGGTVAQEIALAAQDRVKTLTLAFTWAGAGAWSRQLGEVWSGRRPRMTLEEHVDELLVLTHSEEFFERDGAIEWIRGMLVSDPHPQVPEAFARQLLASSKHEARDRVGTLRMPVHVIGAERDLLIPVWKAEELASLIPGATLTIIDKAPHAAHVERSRDFNRMVLDFVAKHAAAPAPMPR